MSFNLSKFLTLVADLFGDVLSFRDQSVGLQSRFATQSVDFNAASSWTALSADKTQLNLSGLKVTAEGGVLSRYYGASVLSPSDQAAIAAGKTWVSEIDTFNDSKEGIRLDFATAQKSLTVTLWQTYVEQAYAMEAEKVDYTLHFSDGSSATGQVLGVQTSQPGEVVLNIDASITAGKYVVSAEFAPSADLPAVPEGTNRDPYFNAPISEFTLKAVSYTNEITYDTGRNLCLRGGLGDDKLIGGRGDDVLNGSWGNDFLSPGGGDNYLTGGKGRDTFAFGWKADGDNVITDFTRGQDKLRLDDGITVTAMQQVGKDLFLTFSNGGHVELMGVTGVTDWHSLLY